MKLLMAQLTGVVTVAGYTFFAALAFWYLLKKTVGIRVSLHEEVQGLDIGEHGNSAYPDFMTRKFGASLAGSASSTNGSCASGSKVCAEVVS